MSGVSCRASVVGLVASAIVLHAQEPVLFDASAQKVDRPVFVCEVDLNVLKGELRRLSWAHNGESLHLQTQDGRDLFDYIVDVGNGVLSRAFGEPAWSAEYWDRKSALKAPGLPSLVLDVTENTRRTRPTPFTGGFANGGAQTFDPKNPVDAFENEVTLRYLRYEIGHWINGAPMAGDTFSWGPEATGALAFTDKAGRLTLIDPAKRTQTIPGVRDASFPAWTIDGSRIAFLQKAGRRQYRLLTAVLH